MIHDSRFTIARRMSGFRFPLFLLFLSTLNFQLSTCPAQGPLTPPGAPAPTMKTLDQIEPRTPVNATRTPGDADSVYRISQPGSYYLTTNLNGTVGEHVIQIDASNVTLDLCGFRILGNSGGLDGINVNGPQGNITIKNGSIRTCGDDGIDAVSADTVRIQDLTCRNNDGDGIVVGPDSILINCIVAHNLGNGINAGDNSTLNNCVARENAGVGLDVDENSTITGCVARANGGHGMSTGANCVVTGSTFQLNGGNGLTADLDSSVSDCAARENSSSGISASTGATVRGCTSRFNGTIGINVGDHSTVVNCSVSTNGADGIFANSYSTVKDCSASKNGGDGIQVESHSIVNRCTASFNKLDGIRTFGGCQITGNLCNGNGNGGVGAGIHAVATINYIEGNQVSLNDRGIATDIGGSIIIRNSASNNSGLEYDITGASVFGPIVTSVTVGADENPHSNYNF